MALVSCIQHCSIASIQLFDWSCGQQNMWPASGLPVHLTGLAKTETVWPHHGSSSIAEVSLDGVDDNTDMTIHERDSCELMQFVTRYY